MDDTPTILHNFNDEKCSRNAILQNSDDKKCLLIALQLSTKSLKRNKKKNFLSLRVEKKSFRNSNQSEIS